MKFNHIISLGNDCFVRSFMTKTGAMKTKADGQMSCPFDLMQINNINDLYKIISSDFSFFFTDLQVCDGMPCSKSMNFVHEVTNHCIFNEVVADANNHNTGGNSLDFITNDFELLKERYSQRIKNYFNKLQDDNILFIYHSEQGQQYPWQLLDVLSNKYPKLNFKLMYINTCTSNTKVPEIPYDDNNQYSQYNILNYLNKHWAYSEWFIIPQVIHILHQVFGENIPKF